MDYVILTLKKMFRYILKPLSFLPALCMMYLIFSFSAQSGPQSSELSLSVSEKLLMAADRILELDLDPARLAAYAQAIHGLVRKLAHVTEYFLLAVCVALPLYVYRLRGFWLVLAAGLFCICFAGLDEYHQSFISGRSPSLRDVGIDSIGIFAGIYFTRIFGFLGRKTIFAPLSMEKRRRAGNHSPNLQKKKN